MKKEYDLENMEWISTRLKMGTTSNFSRYIRMVEDSKEGIL